MSINCLQCNKFTRCSDERKSPSFSCKKFKPYAYDAESALSELSFSQGFGQPSLLAAPIVSDWGKAELDLVDMVSSILSSDTSIPRDLRVDDRDIKEFPNFYEFCTSPKGAGIIPFARQAYVGLKVFGEICQRCSNPKWKTIEDIPVDLPAIDLAGNLQFLKYGVCPKCKATKLDLIRSRDANWYVELAMCMGQRAGKSSTTSFLVAYLVHRFIKLQKPTEVFGLLPNSTLTATFVALTYQRAYALLWAPIRDIITESPWFKEYHAMLDHTGDKLGEELYNNKDSFIHYRHRKLLLNPLGPNKRTLRGDTRFIYAIDELGWFPTGEANEELERANADEVYVSLDRSLSTVRNAAKRVFKQGYYNIPTGYAFNISSPASQRDKIMTLVKDNRTSRDIYAVHLPTWGFNPNFKKRDFKKQYNDDPIKADRDFGANPPLSDSPFIENLEIINHLFSNVKNLAEYEYVHKKSKQGAVMRAGKLSNLRKPGVVQPSVLAIDAGFSNNSFSMIVMHRNPDEHGPKVIVDTMVEIMPEKGKTVLNYARIFSGLIAPMMDALNIQVVLADRWNSLMLLHTLEEDYDCTSIQYSVKYDDFILVKSYMEGKGFSLPKLEDKMDSILTKSDMGRYPHNFEFKPVSHFYLQCATVTDTGRTVTKGTKLTDDLFRAFTLGACHVLDQDFCDEFLRVAKIHGNLGIGAFAALSSGMGSGGSSSNLISNIGQGIASSSQNASSSTGMATARNVFAVKRK